MVLVNDCHSDVSPVNISDSDSDSGSCVVITTEGLYFDGLVIAYEGDVWYKFEGNSCYGYRTEQWHTMHDMLLRFACCIPVLILKSQRHNFSQTNNFSQIIKFGVV